MARTVISGLVGGFLFYVWGMLSWMVLPMHVASVGVMPNEAAVTEVLSSQGLESGVYIAPWTDDEAEWEDPESEWAQKHLSGPIYSIFYRADGAPVMDPKAMMGGLVIDLIGGLLAALFLHLALPNLGAYWKRVAFVTGLGLFVGIIAHLGYWNWMGFSGAWTQAFMVDGVVGWALGGAAMAALQKPAAAADGRAMSNEP